MDIHLEESTRSTITGIKLYVTCNCCKRTWGVNLLDLARQPEGWDRCVECQRMDRIASLGSVNHEQHQSIQG